MKVLNLVSRVEQAFSLADAPDLAFRYFAGNDGLLKQFLGEDRVENLELGVYRVKLNPHGAFGLTLQPSFDVAFIEHPPDRVEMKSLRASLVDSSHEDVGFDARFEGEAQFKPEGTGTRVACHASMHVAITLPPILAWMPVAPLEVVANGIVQAGMLALGQRLVPLMQRDIRRWSAQQVAAT